MLELKNLTIRKELKLFIRKITLFQSRGNIQYKQRLMPSIYAYVSYNMGDIPIFKSTNLSQQPNHRMQIIGPKTNTDIYVEHMGNIVQIIFEFTPTGFYSLFGKSPEIYCNKLTDYNNINEDKQLEKSLITAKTIDSCCDIIQQHLVELSVKYFNPDTRIKTAITIIENKKGIVNIQDLCKQVNMGIRNFSRLFKDFTGVSPQIFAKIYQLHGIIYELANGKNKQMYDVAYLSGFFDQPHFNRSFKKLVNMSPSQFLKSKEHISLEYFA